MDRIDTASLSRLESLSAVERIQWALSRFPIGEIIASSSFGAESAVLLHMISRIDGRVPVVFLNTGFLFPETIAYQAALAEQLHLTVREIRPQLDRASFLREHGPVYRTNPDFCCGCNKVEPMREALKGISCWISGIRRDQADTRKETPVLSVLDGGVHKLHPLYDWNTEEVRRYAGEHGLPEHPLVESGYTSIGCVPCTTHPAPGAGARSGRWAGIEKTECGINTILSPKT